MYVPAAYWAILCFAHAVMAFWLHSKMLCGNTVSFAVFLHNVPALSAALQMSASIHAGLLFTVVWRLLAWPLLPALLCNLPDQLRVSAATACTDKHAN